MQKGIYEEKDPRSFSLIPKQSEFFNQVFDFQDGQIKIRESQYDTFAYFGGYGSGKSFVVMLCILLLCVNFPGAKVFFGRATYRELQDSVISQFQELFPASIYEYKYNVQATKFHFKNGSTIYCRAFDDPAKIKSNMYTFAAICQAEEVEEELYLQLLGRMRHRLPNVPKTIMFLEGNPSAGWCKRMLKGDDGQIDFKLAPHIYFVEATTFDNPHLSDTYIQSMMRKYPENWIKRYIFGEWGNYDEMVFNHFSERLHIIDPISSVELSYYSHLIGGDYGYKNPSSFVFGAYDFDDNVIIYDEFYKAGQSIEDLVFAANRYGGAPIIYDFSTKKSDRDGKSVWTELSARGLRLIESNKDEKRNINITNGLFKNNRIFITRNCVNLISELRNYKWKREKLGSNTNDSEKPIDKNNHAIDALLYLVAYITDMKPKMPSLKAYENTLDYHVRHSKQTHYEIA